MYKSESTKFDNEIFLDTNSERSAPAMSPGRERAASPVQQAVSG